MTYEYRTRSALRGLGNGFLDIPSEMLEEVKERVQAQLPETETSIFTPEQGPFVFSGQPTSAEASRANITQLQNAINSAGCRLPATRTSTTGVDGIWGPNTRDGASCLAQAWGGMREVERAFPFVTALMRQTTTTPARTPTPGAPEPGRGPANGNGNGSAAGAFYTQWWFWVGVAGVVGLGTIGTIAALRKRDEEEPELLDEGSVMAFGYSR